MITARPQDKLRPGVSLKKARRNKVWLVDFCDLLMVKTVWWVVAFVIVGKQLSGSERISCLFAKRAVRYVILASVGIVQGGIDPGDVEIVSYNIKDSVGMVRLFPRSIWRSLHGYEEKISHIVGNDRRDWEVV